jgi:pimeloyl-ACP methyl ester carboxylesterase
MPETDVVVVLAHAAWADGSSWNKVIAGLRSEGVKAVAAPLPLTTLADDVAALDQMLERVEGPVVVAGHAYSGAVVASTSNERVASLVYITALAPDEGETVRRGSHDPRRDPALHGGADEGAGAHGSRRPRAHDHQGIRCRRHPHGSGP